MSVRINKIHSKINSPANISVVAFVNSGINAISNTNLLYPNIYSLAKISGKKGFVLMEITAISSTLSKKI
jgi:hypothetical protein